MQILLHRTVLIYDILEISGYMLAYYRSRSLQAKHLGNIFKLETFLQNTSKISIFRARMSYW